MPFNEQLRASIRRRSHFACCLCHDLGVEIHHIVPEGDGGVSTAENAAPLCPTCHERYGANPVKRKFIREARDLWFDICDRRYAPDQTAISEIQTALSEVATKGDIEEAVNTMRAVTVGIPIENRATLPPGLGEKAIDPASIKEYVRFMFPVVAHSGPDACAALARDLTDIGYEDIASLHAMVGYTSQPFAEVVQSERDKGETRMDLAGDIWPTRLFLAILDEHYAKAHYPKLYERNMGRPMDYPPEWRRRFGDPVPRSLPAEDGWPQGPAASE